MAIIIVGTQIAALYTFRRTFRFLGALDALARDYLAEYDGRLSTGFPATAFQFTHQSAQREIELSCPVVPDADLPLQEHDRDLGFEALCAKVRKKSFQELEVSCFRGNEQEVLSSLRKTCALDSTMNRYLVPYDVLDDLARVENGVLVGHSDLYPTHDRRSFRIFLVLVERTETDAAFAVNQAS